MFTRAEIERLQCLREVCDKIAACRLIVDFPKQSHHIFVGTLPDGRIVDEYPRYDDDDFRAFLTHYRKLRAKKEATNLFHIIKLLKSKGEVSDRKQLDHFKNEVVQEGRGWWGAALRDPDGKQILLTQEGFEDLILNGDVFHTDPRKRASLAQAIGTVKLTKAVAFFNYMRFARTVLFFAQKTVELIHHRGYLGEQAAASCRHSNEMRA